MTTRFAILSVMTAHGISGELKCYPLADDDSTLSLPVRCYTEKAEGKADEQAYDLVCLRRAGKFRLIRMAGITDRDAAEAMKNKTIYVDRHELAPPENGTWFLADLLGLRVFEADKPSETLGVVSEIAFGPHQDLLVIKKAGEADLYLPAVRAFLKDVDFAEKTIIVLLPQGLVDLYRGN